MAGRRWRLAAWLAFAGCFTDQPSPSDDDDASAATDDDADTDADGGETLPGDGSDGAPGVCGDGVLDPGEECDDGNVLPGDGCHEDCTLYRLVFVTAESQGKLDGLDGADGRCTTIANEAGHEGQFVAWLSTPDAPASDRIGNSMIPFRRPDGVLVAENFADLTDGSIAAQIEVTAAGGTLAPGLVWTGTSASGDLAGPACMGWSTNLPTDSGRVGSTLVTDQTWTDAETLLCSLNARLYCFER